MEKMILTKEGLVREDVKPKETVQPIKSEQLKNLVKEVTKILKNLKK